MSELFEDCTCKAVLLDIKEMLAEQQQQFQDHGRHQEARITILKAKVDRLTAELASRDRRIKVALALCEAWDDNAADAIEAALRGESA